MSSEKPSAEEPGGRGERLMVEQEKGRRMTEASWSGGDAGAIAWTMSASLEDVPRGSEQVPEVTSLEKAVRAWQALAPEQRDAAVLTSERPVTLPGETLVDRFVGEAIGRLAEQLPSDGSSARQ